MMTIKEVAELVKNTWMSYMSGSIDHHQQQRGRGPGRHSLVIIGEGRGPQTDQSYHISIRLPVLGDLAPEHVSDRVAEVAHDRVKDMSVHPMLIIKSLTGKQWLMLPV